MRDRKTIQDALDDIAVLLSLSEQSRFKAQAYERGAEVVRSLGGELEERIETGRLKEVEGIGASLEKQIVELWETGKSPLLEKLSAEHPPGTAQLARLPGITPLRLKALQSGLGVQSVEQLRNACEGQRVRALPGFGAKTEQRILAAIVQRERPSEAPRQILLSAALALATRLEEALVQSKVAERVFLAGSARRAEETVAQLDLVVVGRREQILARLTYAPSVLGFTSADQHSATASLSDGIPLRVHVAQGSSLGARLVCATGTAAHLATLRGRAAERGLTLDEEGLRTSDGTVIETPDEETLYAALGAPVVPAELRTGGAELSEAQAGALETLVQLADVRGAVHCHTTYSDGKDSIEAMARAAEALGFEYITITDHSPSAHYASGLSIDELKRQWDEIAAVQERVNIRILRGAESDILADGALDYPDAVLDQLDVVIASIHSRFRMDKKTMTERLIRAMELPLFKIWGHALGRLLLKRDPIDCDVEAVLDALARSRGAIELNGDPHRLDLPPAWIRHARARGIPFVLSVDAHSTRGLSVLDLAVKMARRGGLRRDEVLNTFPVDAFAARIKPSLALPDVPAAADA